MSSKRQGDFLKELQSQKEPAKQERFTWKADASGSRKGVPEALGLTNKKRYSEGQKKAKNAFVGETREHKQEIRKPRGK